MTAGSNPLAGSYAANDRVDKGPVESGALSILDYSGLCGCPDNPTRERLGGLNAQRSSAPVSASTILKFSTW